MISKNLNGIDLQNEMKIVWDCRVTSYLELKLICIETIENRHHKPYDKQVNQLNENVSLEHIIYKPQYRGF